VQVSFEGAAVNDADAEFLRRAIAVAQEARVRGDEPFGAVLVDASGMVVAEARNSKITDRDPTGHAEINLVRSVARQRDVGGLDGSTLYASTEPCAMCSAAIYWSGIGRVVFGLGSQTLLGMVAANPEHDALVVPSREIFARGKRAVRVEGPLLEDEAAVVHEGFWA
jgi:tRNA(Arg) A34 adenosine deaminase TadA